MSSRFLGFDFSPVRLEDRPELEAFLRHHPQRLSGYSFACLGAWNETFRYGWCRPESDALLISCIVDPDRNRHLLQPVGRLSSQVEEQIAREGSLLPYPLRIVGVTDEFLSVHPGVRARFAVEEDRPNANYVYSAQDLATLGGRKFSAKRNLIAQAEKAYAWSFEAITPSTEVECAELARQIRDEMEGPIPPSLVQDMLAIDFTLRHLRELGLQGYLVRVGGKVVAFCLWEPTAPRMAVVHFERALRNYKGLYQLLNREVAKALLVQGFELINREEDLGDPGLRQAKLSYNPVEIVKASVLALRRDAASEASSRP
jgi:hypothetical protein